MTAQSLINESRFQLNDPNKEFYSDNELLAYLNAGIRFLAGELKLWATSEEIALYGDTDTYTIQGSMVQPIKCYDSNGNRRPINENNYENSSFTSSRTEALYGIDPYSIFVISPKQIQVIKAEDDVILSFDYYNIPAEYALASEMTEISYAQTNLLSFYIMYRAALKTRGQANEFTIANKNAMQQIWLQELNAYKAQNPTTYFRDEMPNRLFEKGVL